ncbi:MAG: sodium:solute symporter family protein [Clostridiales bacterium]|nr:sodium:solute symporter family protein [Clostridiales bacterium]
MLQLIIILLYVALTAAIGIWSSKKSKSSDSFHGTALSVYAIVAASAGEWLGGTSTTGVSEYGFDYGLSGAWYTVSNGIGIMFLALLFAKLYRSFNSVTVPGIIEKFFGVKARTVSSVLLTVVMLAVGLSQMIAAGKLGQSLLGFPFVPTVVVFAAVSIVYTLAGGMNAVASTNKMHLFVLYGGVLTAIIFALIKLGGIDNLIRGLNGSEVSKATAAAIAAAGDKAAGYYGRAPKTAGGYFNMFTIGFTKVSSWIIASVLGACTAQAGIQPVLAARDVRAARKACIITALVVAPFGFFTAMLGLFAKALFNNGTMILDKSGELVNGKSALPTLMMNLSDNPIVGGIVGGLVLASILAALSTVAPIILASGTMVTKDIYQRVLKPGATDKQVLLVSRITTAVSGVICCIGAIALVQASAVLDIVYAAYSLRGAIFVIVLFGIYWKRASEPGACRSMIFTGAAAVGWKAFELITGRYPISDHITETYAAVIVAVITTVVFSYILPKKKLA